MSDTTANLSLPLILPAQAQKHVTHNEAIWRLDVLVQAAVEDRNRSLPPASAVEGQRHLVGPGASGGWAGHEGEVAVFTGAGWDFLTPRPGWRMWVVDEALDLIFTEGVWQDGTADLLQAAALGLNTNPDPANRLSVAAPASLLTHEGAGHQLKVNKATPSDTASLLFQTGFSGRAEMGLAGNDDFSIKVSANGSTFTEALRIDRVTGRPTAPQGLQVASQITGTAVTQSATDTTAGRLLKVGDFGVGGAALGGVTDLNNATAPGEYAIAITTTLNKPGVAGGAGVLKVQKWGGADIIQKFTTHFPATHSGRVFSRAYLGGAWQSWRELYSQQGILGTVSQASGVPTGAVIERGSNANGEYVRFADGTQICTSPGQTGGAASTAVGNLYRTGDMIWAYPAGFAAEPRLSAYCRQEVNHWATIRPNGSGNTTSALMRGWAGASQTQVWEFCAVAFGRWF